MVTTRIAGKAESEPSVGYDFHKSNGDNGNVFGITNYKDANRNQIFTYDGLNRVTSAQNAGTDCNAKVLQNKTEYWGNSYTYDAWGNLLGKTITKCGAENLSLTADAHNWIHGPGTDYQYDAAGNMTYDATSSLNYAFDQENRITGAAGYAYTYDGDGNRVRKSNGILAGNGTLYWYISPGVMAETDLAGTTKSEYVFFDGERVARRDGPTGTGGVFYYFSDHLKTASVTYAPWNNGSVAVSTPQEAKDLGSSTNYITGGVYGPDLSLTNFVSGSGGAASITNTFTYNKRLQPLTMSAATTSQSFCIAVLSSITSTGASGQLCSQQTIRSHLAASWL
jgi:hypothetical protein